MDVAVQRFRNTVELLPSLSYTYLDIHGHVEHFLVLSWLSFGVEISWSKEVTENE